MPHRLAATLTLLAALSAAPSARAGDPITAETVADVAEMTRIADAIDAAVDAKDWAAARGYFADEIDVDFTGLVGGESATIPADALIDGWSANLTAEKPSFHLRGNHAVTLDGDDRATMTSVAYAWNRMERGAEAANGGDPMWEVWGTYVHGFARTESGWEVTSMSFAPTAQRGNPWVRDTPGS